MQFTQFTLAAIAASLATAQTLNIPARVGNVQRATSQRISANRDFGMAEFDSSVACAQNGNGPPVFILNNSVTISNLIIGPNQGDNAVSALGASDVLIKSSGATGANNKVIQHNKRGRVTIRNYTVTNSRKLYRSCGNCSNNQANSPRSVVIENVRASGMTSDLVGINNNYGDTATISNTCGSNNRDMCENYLGVEAGQGDGPAQDNNNGCSGQGTVDSIPAC